MSYDNSYQLHSTHQSPRQSKRSRYLLGKDESLNISAILNETTTFKTLNDTSLRQVLDESSVLINTGNAGDGLSEAFFEIIQSSRPSTVLDTIARLAQACCDSLELVEPWNRYNAQNYWLAEEANTWKLIFSLFADSISEHPKTLESQILEPTLSQQRLVNAYFETESELRLLQVLVTWLEVTATYQEGATQTAAPVIGNNIHWGNTLHQLLIGSSLFNKEKNNSMITCMDPDAPRRQNKTIHSDDKKDDDDLCKRIFTEVRCGKFQEAVSLCISAGQAWRGAVLQGWKLLHYEPGDVDGTLEVTGNSSRDLWKWCALGIANNVSENTHFRATVGILCGHLPSALPACQGNWEDLLWAHLRVQIEARVDKFLHEHHATAEANTTPSDILDLLQSELQIDELSLQQIFNSVKSLMDGKRESNYQMCQRNLMLGHIRAIMQDCLEWLDSAEERFVRFLAHLILVLRQMGKDPQHDIGDKILEKYVIQIIEGLVEGTSICPELIAYYTSTVPVERQIALYAELMDRVQKSENRLEVVRAGTRAGIDVAASARVAIKKAITDIQQGYGNIDLTFTQTTAVEKDKTLVTKVISSLEWLSFMSNQIEEGLWLSNAMVRTFIFIGNTNAALLCVNSVSKMFDDFTNKVPKNSSELREHICLKSYLEAIEAFATWYRHFISGQPKDIEPLAPDASFSDKVHHEQRCAHIEQQKARWQNAILHQSRQTKQLLYNILLFPGGWLQDENDSISSHKFTNEEKEERNKQLDTLRRLCLPEVALLIFKILQSSDDIDNHKEALKMSNLIASENRGLYQVFTKSKLLEVLDRIKESSLFLVEKGKDILGYELDE
ncbi:nuclear pore complex protein Nup107 [Vanessa cardui]|uniref:nuclear pore complex protein Nup107 n=1 Tax=Vanessa cardui TaxID=171605 RepID=UPI001F13FB39|nr:nuclear pore complex protein Nup107 [Vanessa cardui]